MYVRVITALVGQEDVAATATSIEVGNELLVVGSFNGLEACWRRFSLVTEGYLCVADVMRENSSSGMQLA